MDSIIKEHKLLKTKAYLDDVIVGGNDKEEHDQNVHKFLAVSKELGMTLNKDKCSFGITKISMLGQVLENGTKRPDPVRLQTLMNYHVPTTAVQLRRLLGFFGKWVSDYSNKILPILQAQRAKRFPLSRKALDAIEQLMADIANSSLVIPQSSGTPIRIETDASGSAIGASLLQNDSPIACFSRTLSNAEQKQSAVELEAMAAVEAFRKWEQFIRSYPTLVLTDQKAIAFIFYRQKLIRWRLELSQYRYEISYRPGSQNLSVDVLSGITDAHDSQIASLHKSLAHPGNKL